MWCIRLSCFLIASLIIVIHVVGVVRASSIDETRLRVSVRKDALQGGSSCIHSLSQVELLNLDPTEPITVHSVHTTPEETVFSVRDKNSFDQNEVIPPQFQLLRLQSGGLTLQPNQVALVPLSFLPRYPHIFTEAERNSRSDNGRKKRKGRGDGKQKPALDSASEPDSLGSGLTDLEYLDGNEYLHQTISVNPDNGQEQRSNLGLGDVHGDAEYLVHTTIVVDTSRGIREVQLSASSHRKNQYGVPDTIRFYDVSPKDCYHLHVSNPSQTRSFEIREMMVSRSDVVTVEHDLDYSREHSSRNSVVRGWNTGGPFILSPGARDVYVATLCSLPRGVDGNTNVVPLKDPTNIGIDPGNPETSLGYLQMRTESDSLFIILERAPKTTHDFLSDVDKLIAEFGSSSQAPRINKGDRSTTTISESPGTLADTPDVGGSATEPLDEASHQHMELPQQRVMVPTKLGNAQTKPQALVDKASHQHMELPPQRDMVPRKLGNAQTKLQAIPPRANFLLVTSSKANATLKIGLHNSYLSPVKIMVAKSVMMVSNGDLNMNLEFGNMLVGNCQDHPQNCTSLGNNGWFPKTNPIPAGATVDDLFTLSCSVGSDSFSWGFSPSKRAVRYNGTVVVRGSSNTSLSYEEWNEQMRLNPYAESHLRLEIPYSVIVTDGRVDFAMDNVASFSDSTLLADNPIFDGLGVVSALFFPILRSEIRVGARDRQSIAKTGGIERHLRIFSPLLLSLTPDVEIREGKVNKRNRAAASQDGSFSLCSRFLVTSISGPAKNNRQPSPETQLFDLGTISLKYVPEPPDEQLDRFVSQTCYLSLSTEPVAASVNSIPLVIFSGNLEVATSDTVGAIDVSAKQGSAVEGSANGTVRSQRYFSSVATGGFDNVFSWFQSSYMGSMLSSVLQTIIYPGRRQSLSQKCSRNGIKDSYESYLLCRYLWGISNSSISKGSSLHPILLEHGAIGHGEIQTTSLYLTNHNPVAVEVFVDVGEVQGMSISLGRDVAHEKNDGNSIVDYLPKHGEGFNEKASSKEWTTHSLNGMRHFLTSSDLALSLFARFTQRDAVSLSQFAVKNEPLLRTLYRKSAKADFHKHKVLECHPPVYSQSDNAGGIMFRNGTGLIDEMPGPLLLSVDQGMIYPLRITSDEHRFSGCLHQTPEYRGTEEMESTRRSINIPPGGVARFDVQIRGPPKESLEKDITPLIASGLVLSTNFGEVMPIISTFEVLVGQLRVSHVPAPMPTPNCAAFRTAKRGTDVEVIDIPPGLFRSHSDFSALTKVGEGTLPLIIPPGSTSGPSENKTAHFYSNGVTSNVSLHLTSTFSREVSLKEVESCNPWFTVVLKDGRQENAGNATEGGRSSSAVATGVEIGTLHSVISCLPIRSPVVGKTQSASERLPEFPSFYQCALNWLESRSALQPRGCGQEAPPRNRRVDNNDNYETEDRDVARVKLALKNAVTYLGLFYGGWKKHRAQGEQTSPPSSFATALDKFGTGTSAASPAVKSGIGRGDDTLNSNKIDLFAEVTDAWKDISELGLNKVTTSLRATIDYSCRGDVSANNASTCGVDGGMNSPEIGKRSLTVSMEGLALQTVLSTPRLFDCTRAKQRTRRPKVLGDEAISVLDFPPTLVANVVALSVPVRNPTSVPVRIRLSSVLPAALNHDHVTPGTDNDFRFSVNDSVRARYLQYHNTVYVQKSYSSSNGNEEKGQLWWDGGGAFFLGDEKGNLIQSHHNVTIKAGAGAHVSLVNPSLHATSAFVVGCGARCADRDDTQSTTTKGLNIDKTAFGMARELSPIGASSGAGSTLLGRPSLTTQVNGVDILDPFLSAGGSPPASAGPAAFAIPYSSLDEIILPPYGEAELGPILFRPPGRRSILGCDFPVDKSSHTGEGTPEACLSKYFESMVFLENSLTGLERVVLRGRGVWEHVVFLDPPAPEGADEVYGDIENRHGRSTLVFPGSGHRETDYPGAKPIIKSVVVHNAGDVQVEFGGVYFSDAALGESTFRRAEPMNEQHPKMIHGDRYPTGGCANRNFRLLGCWDGDHPVASKSKKERRNIRRGFRLLPGHNRTLYIEHRPDCTFREEYVTLNLEYRRPKSFLKSDSMGNFSVSGSGGWRHTRASHWERSFRKRKVELFVGFDMTNSEVAACIPVHPRQRGLQTPQFMDLFLGRWFGSEQASCGIYNSSSIGVSTSSTPPDCMLDFAEDNMSAGTLFLRLTAVILSLVWIAFNVAHGVSSRHQSCLSFTLALRGSSFKTDPVVQSDDTHANTSSTSSLWSAAFRCLARADPSSPELQTLGREQVRQVVLNRYKSLGVNAPQCMSSLGGFQRERPGSGGGAVVKNNGKEGNIGGGEKIRTLSDALFQDFVSNPIESESAFLPCGLDWRTAVAREIVDTSPVAAAGYVRFPTRVRELLLSRSLLIKTDDEISVDQALHELETAAPSEPEAHENAEPPDFGNEMRADDKIISASETESGRVSSKLPEENRFSAPDAANKGEENIKIKVVAEAETGNDVSNGTRRMRQTELKQSVPELRNGGRSGEKGNATLGGNGRPNDESPSQKTAVAKNRKENGSVGNTEFKNDASKTVTSATNKPNQRKNNAALEKVKQQKEKSKPEHRHGAESSDTRSSDGSDSVGKKGTHRVPSTSSRKADNTFKRSDKSNLGSKDNRQRVAGKAAGTGDAIASPIARKGKPSSLAPIIQQAPTVSRKKIKPPPSPSVPDKKTKPTFSPSATFSPGVSSRSWSPQAAKASPRIRPPPGLAPPPGFDSPTSSEITSTVVQHDLGLALVPSIEKVSGADSVECFSSLVPRAYEPPFLKDETDALVSSSSSSTPGNKKRLLSSALSSNDSGSSLVQTLGGKVLTQTDLDLPSLSPSISFSTDSARPVVKKDVVSDAAIVPPIAKPVQSDGKPLLGLGGGFNVMDFLDGILNDANSTAEEPDVDDASDEVPEGSLPGAMHHRFPPYPAERKSRASAYGIAVEETNEEVGVEADGTSIVRAMLSLTPERQAIRCEDVDNMVNSIPLLTPAAILGVTEAQSVDEQEQAPLFNRSSFHASLLDE